MDDRVIEFLTKHNIGVVSFLLQGNIVHSAVMNYSFTPVPLTFYFSTNAESKKAASIKNGETVKGALVIGFSEVEWATLQCEGDMQGIREGEEFEKARAIYIARLSHGDPSTLMIKFTPSWMRYSNVGSDPSILIEWSATKGYISR